MKFLFGAIVVTAFFLINDESASETPVANFTISDSIQIDVLANYDSLGLLANYQARISTPVCEPDKCYAIDIIFYWDVIGRFQGYDTIPKFGLTKLDHKPFSDLDYKKLDDILQNPNSPLALYTKEQLVQNTRSSEIDGFTGATIQAVKGSVIEGAVYSCHVLWHIAHGAVVDSVRQVTVKSWSREFVGKLVSLQDQEINYFLIDNFSEEDFQHYLPEVLQTISIGKGYYAKNAIESMPENLLSEEPAQGYFAANFSQLNYFAQVALLKKLNRDHLSDGLKNKLKQELDERDSYKNELIRQLLGVAEGL